MPLRTPRNLFYLLLLSCTVSTVLLILTMRNFKGPRPKAYAHQWIEQMQFNNRAEYLNLTELRRYLLQPENCGKRNIDGQEEELLALIVVTSDVDNWHLRELYRESISQRSLWQLRMQRVFLLASKYAMLHSTYEKNIIQEQHLHGDILQGSFLDTYYNNYQKNVMGLDWAARHCAHAKFIVKMDDDVVHNVYRLHDILQHYSAKYPKRVNSSQLLIGNVRHGSRPIRNRTYKWYTPKKEYGPSTYPDYLPGCMYVSNPKTAGALVQQVVDVPIFWIDDIWITGILREYLNFALLKFEPYTEASGVAIERCLREFRLYHLKCPYMYHHCLELADCNRLAEFQMNGQICHFNGGRLCKERTWYRHVNLMFWELMYFLGVIEDERDPMQAIAVDKNCTEP